MATGITLGYDLFRTFLIDTTTFNITWFVSILATWLSLATITKDKDQWKELAFPVMVGWHIAGLPPFILAYIAAGILWALKAVSIDTITTLVSTVSRPITATFEARKSNQIRKAQQKRLIDKEKSEIFLTRFKNSMFGAKTRPIDISKGGFISPSELKELIRKSRGK